MASTSPVASVSQPTVTSGSLSSVIVISTDRTFPAGLQVNGSVLIERQISVTVNQDLTITSGSLSFSASSNVQVGGSLSLSSGSQLVIYIEPSASGQQQTPLVVSQCVDLRGDLVVNASQLSAAGDYTLPLLQSSCFNGTGFSSVSTIPSINTCLQATQPQTSNVNSVLMVAITLSTSPDPTCSSKAFAPFGLVPLFVLLTTLQ